MSDRRGPETIERMAVTILVERLLERISFLRSVVASGESLSQADRDELDALCRDVRAALGREESDDA